MFVLIFIQNTDTCSQIYGDPNEDYMKLVTEQKILSIINL